MSTDFSFQMTPAQSIGRQLMRTGTTSPAELDAYVFSTSAQHLVDTMPGLDTKVRRLRWMHQGQVRVSES